MSSELAEAPYIPKVGDKVRTPDGEGYVSAVVKWQQVVGEMRESEAVEFGQTCLAQLGKNWQKMWFRAYVTVDGIMRRYERADVVVLEKRMEHH